MNRIRHGKIARLPQRLREELNRRLDQGAQGGPLLQWLNSQPEVQAVLAADFGGRPINKQSLSQWRRGGYAEWLRLQEAQALAGPMPAETRESPPLADQMAAWAAARGLLAVRELAGPGGTEAAPLKTLREACRDLVALRQENHTAARAQFELARCQLLSGLPLDPAEPCPESAPVRPGQTFEFLNFPRNPESVGEKNPPSWPRISDFGFLSDFGLRPSDFPSASAPVRPSQTFEIFKNAHNSKKHPAAQAAPPFLFFHSSFSIFPFKPRPSRPNGGEVWQPVWLLTEEICRAPPVADP